MERFVDGLIALAFVVIPCFVLGFVVLAGSAIVAQFILR
tara:strand:+ start:338 stop:454 length:117 start_codon:yes stop_codon:yes gene_type:complete